ncbi:MAG: hypothetical protein WAW37_15155 [Syntrophobacteraceae bacterium]
MAFIMNLLEEVTGKLPEDKDSMLTVIDRYLGPCLPRYRPILDKAPIAL